MAIKEGGFMQVFCDADVRNGLWVRPRSGATRTEAVHLDDMGRNAWRLTIPVSPRALLVEEMTIRAQEDLGAYQRAYDEGPDVNGWVAVRSWLPSCDPADDHAQRTPGFPTWVHASSTADVIRFLAKLVVEVSR